MSFPRMLGFVGKKFVGKSASARFTHNHFTPVSFAHPMKQMLLTMGLTAEEVYGSGKDQPLAEFGGQTPRDLMLSLGTEWGRDMVHPDIWVRMWERRVSTMVMANIVIDDIRMPNEYDAVKSHGGVIVKVFRPEVEEDRRHRTEQYDFAHDHIILNDGDLNKLQATVRKLMLILQG